MKLRADITTFAQYEQEPLYDAWERFKDLLRRFPHHELQLGLVVQTFYYGLLTPNRTIIDAAAYGNLLRKTAEEGYELLEEMAASSYHTQSERNNQRRSAEVHQVTDLSAINAQLDVLNRKLYGLNMGGPAMRLQEIFVISVEVNTLRMTVKKQKKGSCSTLVQNKIPPKLKDPRSFSIPCMIGDVVFHKTLYDLGAIINLMHLYVFRKLGLEEPKPTKMSLQPADRSVKYPRRVIEDVLVKVDKFIFPADFVVLDMEKDIEMPLILGRPFLSTGKAIIDVQEGKLRLIVGKEEITFDVFNALKHILHSDSCFRIDAFDSLASNYVQDATKDPLEATLTTELDEEKAEIVTYLNANHPWKRAISMRLEDLGDQRDLTPQKSSIEEPTTLELKPLLPHLKYVYLGENNKLPVIISFDLTYVMEGKLLKVLKEHRSAFAWNVADIKGINPSVCMHKILMEDKYSPIVQPQRRLNPKMPEVVKAETIKLLDAGIIYPISDGTQVSPVQCVPKKGGIIVITNEKNELIPTRTVTGWRVCIEYRKLNDATRKDHFPLPFIDQMLERRMPFGLCNAPAMFQRCMTAIFPDMIETFLEIFMDDFSIFGSSFDDCLQNLKVVLMRCEETNFVLNWEKCHFMAYEDLKERLVTAPVLVAPDWDLPFEVMCDASDTAVGEELLAVVFALDKFHSYLVLSKVIVYTEHPALKYLLAKKDAKPRLIRWVLLLQEFYLEIKDKNGVENVVADHLSRLELISNDCVDHAINDWFPDEQLFEVNHCPWYANFANFLVTGTPPPNLSFHQRKKFFSNVKHYFWEEPFLFKICLDSMIRRCIVEEEFGQILNHCHDREVGGHFKPTRTKSKVLECGFYWPTLFKDARSYVLACDKCQRTGTTPYRLLFGKARHLPVELENRAYWATEALNFNFTDAGERRLLQLEQLEEFRNLAYDLALSYKEKTKRAHDRRIIEREFKEGTVELKDGKDGTFTVNAQRLKHYKGGTIEPQLGITRFQDNPN
ncbi:uncharacterized protein [Primulina huaijiensis]|uniref:uncharacterized protein n=1 Tax=Primulina huaijiensis TaxID=1492673 RepID=UPI003CC6FB02